MSEENIENIEEEEKQPIEVKITNKDNPWGLPIEVSVYDSQDDIEYQDMEITQEQFEKDVDENNGT